MTHIPDYQPVPNVEPPSADDLNKMAKALEDVLANRTHLVAVAGQNRLEIVDRPTGFWAGVARLVGWKAENQKFNNVALCAKKCLKQAHSALPEHSNQDSDQYIAAFTRLNSAYQKFIAKKISSELLFDANIPSLIERQVKVLAAKETELKALLAQEAEVRNRMYEVASRTQAQERALESMGQTRLAAAERNIQEKDLKWRQEILHTPITKVGELNPVALIDRAEARDGGLELDVVIECANKELVYAHSKYLKPLSDYFNASLSGKWKKDKPLDFKGYPAKTMQLLLDFLYLGTLQKFEPVDLINLYQLAHTMDLPKLQELCKKELQRCLCQEHSLIYDLMIGYFEQPGRHPAVIDLFFNLLPDCCNWTFADYPQEREQLAQLLRANAPPGDRRYDLLESHLMNPNDPLDHMVKQNGGNRETVRKIVEEVAKAGYYPAYSLLGDDGSLHGIAKEINLKFWELGSHHSLVGLLIYRLHLPWNESSIQSLIDMNYGPALGSAAFTAYPTEKDKQRAVQLAERSAERGCAVGFHVLGLHYLYKDDTHTASIEQAKIALPYLRKVADMNYYTGHNCARVGIILYSLGEYDQAVEYFKKGADLKNAYCQYNLALCLERGRGIEADLVLARKLYTELAHTGDVDAQKALARWKPPGQGVEYIPPADSVHPMIPVRKW